jgi:hypothetical protein
MLKISPADGQRENRSNLPELTRQDAQPTPYPEVNAILDVLLSEVRSLLGDQFVGMYLYGSLTTGDFNRESDVDYIVVTKDAVSDEFFAALDAMHQRIATMDAWCATQLEGSYIPREALRQYDPVRALHVHIDRGEGERLHRMHLEDPLLSRAWSGGWVILRHTLRERGITLAGPPPDILIEPVSPTELRKAVVLLLVGWTAPILDDPTQIENRGYQAYTVLTICRILYTLQNGSVVSKAVAARWAQETLEGRWGQLIERARSGRENSQLKADPDNVATTLDFIGYALVRSQQFEIKGRPQ